MGVSESHRGNVGLPDSFWKQSLRYQASLDCFSLSVMISEQLVKRLMYALCQQEFGIIDFLFAFSTSLPPFGSLRVSMENSAVPGSTYAVVKWPSFDSEDFQNQPHDRFPWLQKSKSNRQRLRWRFAMKVLILSLFPPPAKIWKSVIGLTCICKEGEF